MNRICQRLTFYSKQKGSLKMWPRLTHNSILFHAYHHFSPNFLCKALNIFIKLNKLKIIVSLQLVKLDKNQLKP